MASQKKNPSNTLFNWLREQLGKGCLAMLVGSDAAALQAAVLIVETWCYSDSSQRPHCLNAFRETVLILQPKCRLFAYHAIAHVHDWSTRATFWHEAGLPPIENLLLCQHEPAARIEQGAE